MSTEAASDNSNNLIARIIKSIVLFLAIFFSSMIMFRNQLFFTNETISSYSNPDFTLDGYVEGNDGFYPIREDYACIVVNNLQSYAYDVVLEFPSTLGNDTDISLYVIDEERDFLVETKTVYSHTSSSFSFHAGNDKYESIRMVFVDKASNKPTSLPFFTVNIQESKFVLFQNNASYYSIVFVSLSVAIISPFLIFFLLNRRGNKNKESIVVSTAVGDYHKNRDSNFELLRIVSMVIILIHHFVVHGGILSGSPYSFPFIIGLIIAPLGKVAFIVFVSISMWFFANGSKGSTKRFIKIWFETLFYSILFAFVTFLMEDRGFTLASARYYFGSLFTITGNSHGFVASYLLFLLLLPFISFIGNRLDKFQATYVTVVLFIAQIFSQIISNIIMYSQPIFSEIQLFIFCYFLTVMLQRWDFAFLRKKKKPGVTVLFVVVILIGMNFCSNYYGTIIYLTDFVYALCGSESSVLPILGGYSLFYLFKNISIKQNRIINYISSSTFAVLLIHDHNFFRHKFWYEIVRSVPLARSGLFVLWLPVSVVCIFIVVMTIEFLRKELLEKPLFMTRALNDFCTKIDTKLCIK